MNDTNETLLSAGNDLNISQQSGIALMHITARHAVPAALQQVTASFDMNIPMQANTVIPGDKESRIFWFGPGSWLVRYANTDKPAINDPDCAITDISDSRLIYKIEGEKSCELLSMGCPLDFRSNEIAPERCAHTIYNHFHIFLYRLAESSFEVYVERSYAHDFSRELISAADYI
jgi:methylglutamate dehydrogenase subunit D